MGEKIVFLSASSGGGHNSAAKALIERLQLQYGKRFEYQTIDIYKNSFNSRLPWLARIRYHSDGLWRLFLAITNNRISIFFISPHYATVYVA